MYQPATYGQMRQAHGGVGGRLLHWLIGAVVLFIAMGGFGIFSVSQGPSPVSCTPPACPIPPPRVHSLNSSQQYTSSAFGYSVQYSTANITPSSTDANSISWDAQLGDGSEVAWSFNGVHPNGDDAEQIVNRVVNQNYSDASLAYSIPNADLGYTPGYGNVYDVDVDPGNGQSVHDRLIVMAAVRNGVGVVFVGLGPYQQTTQSDGHPNPADTPLVGLGDVEQSLESVTWPGQASL